MCLCVLRMCNFCLSTCTCYWQLKEKQHFEPSHLVSRHTGGLIVPFQAFISSFWAWIGHSLTYWIMLHGSTIINAQAHTCVRHAHCSAVDGPKACGELISATYAGTLWWIEVVFPSSRKLAGCMQQKCVRERWWYTSEGKGCVCLFVLLTLIWQNWSPYVVRKQCKRLSLLENTLCAHRCCKKTLFLMHGTRYTNSYNRIQILYWYVQKPYR